MIIKPLLFILFKKKIIFIAKYFYIKQNLCLKIHNTVKILILWGIIFIGITNMSSTFCNMYISKK